MGKAKFADVWLVRAGCTQWDQEGRIVGSTDLPTCQAGLESARACARMIADTAIGTVMCAECEAAQTTARMIAEATEARIKVVDELREIGLGLWEGTLRCDIEDRCPTAYRQWKADPSSVIPPDGEAFEEALARVSEALSHAIPKHVKAGQGLAIVVGPTIHALIKCWLEKRPAADLWQLVEDGVAVERLCVDCVTMEAISASKPAADSAKPDVPNAGSNGSRRQGQAAGSRRSAEATPLQPYPF